MAIFQTGAITNMPNFLNTLVAFCLANGWTSNQNALEGAGRRAHLQLGSDVFVNLRAMVNEGIPSNFGGQYGLIMNASNGYNASLEWYNQPGAPYQPSSPNYYRPVGMVGISGAMPVYYLFARGNMIYCWIEYATGQFQWLIFGRITKTSTWTGGSLIAASNDGTGGNIQNYASIAGVSGGVQGGGGSNPNAYLYGSIEGNTGWMSVGNQVLNVPMPKFCDGISMLGTSLYNMANTYNGQPVLPPIDIYITRDGTADRNAYTNLSIEGLLPDIYYCNMRTLLPAQQVPDGSGGVFRVFPFRQKTLDGVSATGWHGVQIKEN